jgi:hypothetical protein
MALLYRLGIIFSLCAVAVAAGLGVAFFSTTRATPTATGAGVGLGMPTSAPAAAQATTVPATVAAAQATTAPATAAPEPLSQAAPKQLPALDRSAVEILQQVEATVDSMRTGQLNASLDYGKGNRSSASVTFDLGDGAAPAGIHINTTYAGASGRQTSERVTIADRTWQRLADSGWIDQPAVESVRGELRAFLPALDSAVNVVATDETELLALHWLGANGDDITLLIEPDSNLPRQLRQLSGATGTLFTVEYQSWNTPVEIDPPAQAS